MKENGPRTDESRGDAAPTFEHQFYRAMASRERRRLLYVLLDGEERTVEEVATVLVGWDATESGTVGDPDDRNLVLLRLVHIHLPLLDDAGLVAYDDERGRVRAESLDEATREYIERGIDAESESTP
ncbi:DUF7344 domain-containing protein [Halolamina rubra]|uniref:DUF7344 domain-containing protein n=1 Tax=Halolamina rubra TaxID=1380430 RepID=UPI000679DF7A|nr:hypothetical protein [Halolamina rubra]